MSGNGLKRKIRKLLKEAYPEATVHIENGFRDCLHVIMESGRHAHKRLSEQEELLWSVFQKSLTPAEWGRISLSKIVSPEEWNGDTRRRPKAARNS